MTGLAVLQNHHESGVERGVGGDKRRLGSPLGAKFNNPGKR